MRLSAGWLFGLAAGFNGAVGLSLLLASQAVANALGLQPVAGSNLLLLYLTAGFILMFAYAYARIARDPVGFRPLIGFSALGKTVAVAIMLVCWLRGLVDWRVPALGGGDLVFAGLFLAYLRQRPAA